MNHLLKTVTKIANSIQPNHLKMVLIVRTDLKMDKGKIASQCAHAAVICYQQALDSSEEQNNIARRWFNYGQAKIVLKVNSEDALKSLYQAALGDNLNAAYVKDAGHTQVDYGTITVLGIGPNDNNLVDKLVGHLKLANKWRLCFDLIMDTPSDWHEEANAVIKDIKNHVREVHISNLDSSEQYIFLNITTIEGEPYCVEISGNGFRIVGNRHDSKEQQGDDYFETPYSLLSSISQLYRDSFGNELMDKLNKIAGKE